MLINDAVQHVYTDDKQLMIEIGRERGNIRIRRLNVLNKTPSGLLCGNRFMGFYGALEVPSDLL